MLLDSVADVESAKKGRLSSEVLGTPKAILWTERGYLRWLDASPSPAKLFDSAGESASATVELDVQGRLGAWGSPSRIDPPRLYGELKSGDPDADVFLNGPFDAVFCDNFVRVLSD